MDLSDKSSECDEVSSQTPPAPGKVSSNASTNVKTCIDCGTSRTPLWRGGPAGPKSLCNACGIRSRKKRRALLGVAKDEKKTTKKSAALTKNSGGITQQQSNSSNSSSTTSSGGSTTTTTTTLVSNKKGLLWSSFGRDGVFQRPRSSPNRRRKLKEEERAAFLLMELSCGSVFA